MRARFFVGILAILVFISLLVAYWYFWMRPKISINITVDNSILVADTYTLDTGAASAWVEALGTADALPKFSTGNAVRGYSDVTQIDLFVADITTYPESDIRYPVRSQGKVVSGFHHSFEYQQRVLKVGWLVHPELLQGSEASKQELINKNMLMALYLWSEAVPQSNDYQVKLNVFEQLYSQYAKQAITLKQVKNGMPNILAILTSLWNPPKAYAQVCGGSTFQCNGTQALDCECLLEGNPYPGVCSGNGAACGFPAIGTCSCTPGCNPASDSFLGSCSNVPSNQSCDNPSCPDDFCIVDPENDNNCFDPESGNNGNTCPSGQFDCRGLAPANCNLAACVTLPPGVTCAEYVESVCGGTTGPGICEGDIGNCGSPCADGCSGTTACTYLPGVGDRCWSSCCDDTDPPTESACGNVCSATNPCQGPGWTCQPGTGGTSGYCWQGSCDSNEVIVGSVIDTETGQRVPYYPFSATLNGSYTGYLTNYYGSDSTNFHYTSQTTQNQLQGGDQLSVRMMNPPPGYRIIGWEAFNSLVGPGGTPLNCGSGGPAYFSQMGSTQATMTVCIDSVNAPSWPPNNFINFFVERDVNTACTVNAPAAPVETTGTANFSMSGAYAIAGTTNTTKVFDTFITRTDFAQLSSVPAGLEEVVYDPPTGANQYFYKITAGSCTANSGSNCTIGSSISNLPAGNYSAFCHAGAAPGMCSGNPSCVDNGGVTACPGFDSCHPTDDNDAFTVTCTPNCGVSCGQSDGCGGTCPAPTNPTAPTNMVFTGYENNNAESGGQLIMTPNTPPSTNPNTRVRSAWTTAGGPHFVVIYPSTVTYTDAQLNAITTSCTSTGTAGVVCRQANGANYSLTTSELEHLASSSLTVAVQSFSNACNVFGTPILRSGWLRDSISLQAHVTGSVYDFASVGACAGTGTTTNLEPGSSITSDPGPVTPDAFNNDAVYSLLLPYHPSNWGNASQELQLSINNSTPENSLLCAPGCYPVGTECRVPDVYVPSTQHFYVSNEDLSNGPWWQAQGAHLYAGGAIVSDIPQQCVDDGVCVEFLLRNNGDEPESAGVVMSAAGDPVIGDGYTSQSVSNNLTAVTNFEPIETEGFSYSYFDRRVRLPAALTTDTVTELTQLTSAVQISPSSDGTLYLKRSGDLALEPSSTWNFTAGTKVVVLVDGNVTISGANAGTPQLWTVEEGGFFMIIASGDITFDPTVGQTNPNSGQAVVEGVFVATQTLVIQAGSQTTAQDPKFVGAGTFVGLAGVDMQRDYTYAASPISAADNNTAPTELFIYRPDFVTNFPDALREPRHVWQEVNR